MEIDFALKNAKNSLCSEEILPGKDCETKWTSRRNVIANVDHLLTHLVVNSRTRWHFMTWRNSPRTALHVLRRIRFCVELVASGQLQCQTTENESITLSISASKFLHGFSHFYSDQTENMYKINVETISQLCWVYVALCL